jgi:hypothetical protein
MTALLVIGMVNVLTFDVQAHPNDRRTNELVGGPKGAFSKPTWTTGATACCKRSLGARKPRSYRRPVVISGEPWQVIQLDSNDFISCRLNRCLDIAISSMCVSRGSAEVCQSGASRCTLSGLDARWCRCVSSNPDRVRRTRATFETSSAGLTAHNLLRP